ncbi:DUF4191 domain-containing protein [Frankia sp. Cppng1_Ct_nod]|uniref:DUF4191 domain-containing protein n=1 Tax=Frankia sp. Cppng1_Ct_nod TaxID=2897162 RepID=UPI00104164AE|nr:DUF4191 domain-containing protein [Frankia sp. Cppng1_Ct_nod]
MARRNRSEGDSPKASTTATERKQKTDGGVAGPGRLTQIRTVYRLTRQRDPRALWWSLAGLLIPFGIGILLALLVGPLWVWLPIGVMLGLVSGMNVFSRRVQNTAYAEMEGQPGAAAGIVERMRGDWRLTPAVAVNRHQDVVHRVVCRAGVVVIAEGRGRGQRELLGNEVRRVRKVIGETPIHDIVVGNGPGEVPLPKLQATLMRLPRTLRRGEVDPVERRLRAVSAPTLPIPKGPIPRNIPRGGKIR